MNESLAYPLIVIIKKKKKKKKTLWNKWQFLKAIFEHLCLHYLYLHCFCDYIASFWSILWSPCWTVGVVFFFFFFFFTFTTITNIWAVKVDSTHSFYSEIYILGQFRTHCVLCLCFDKHYSEPYLEHKQNRAYFYSNIHWFYKVYQYFSSEAMVIMDEN